jgi:succinate dehydrogenase assembly factor 2
LQKLHNTPGVITEQSKDSNDITVKIEPIKRINEDIGRKRARLTYQSRKRGILETDLLLSRFAKKYLHTFNEAELDEYDKLLDELDWDIYYWATRNFDVTPLPDKWKDSKILGMLQEFSENKERVLMRMPELHD